MKARHLLKGIIRNIPGYKYFRNTPQFTGGTCNARYCYSVLLRHLIHAHQNGYNKIPTNFVELGPGDSLGIGISALISGAEKYFALDVFKYSNVDTNLKIFDDLVKLFKDRSPIPDNTEFPLLKPDIDKFDFPHYIFTDNYIDEKLDEERLMKIKNSIAFIDSNSFENEEQMIYYLVPWEDKSIIKPHSIDMVLSQAVLQHVDDLPFLFNKMAYWLKPGGIASHQIDFKSLNSANTWDGHWGYTDIEWKIIKSGSHYSTNRVPHSIYINYLIKNNFKILCDIRLISESNIHQTKIASKFKDYPSEDLTIRDAFIQAVKV